MDEVWDGHGQHDAAREKGRAKEAEKEREPAFSLGVSAAPNRLVHDSLRGGLHNFLSLRDSRTESAAVLFTHS